MLNALTRRVASPGTPSPYMRMHGHGGCALDEVDGLAKPECMAETLAVGEGGTLSTHCSVLLHSIAMVTTCTRFTTQVHPAPIRKARGHADLVAHCCHPRRVAWFDLHICRVLLMSHHRRWIVTCNNPTTLDVSNCMGISDACVAQITHAGCVLTGVTQHCMACWYQ